MSITTFPIQTMKLSDVNFEEFPNILEFSSDSRPGEKVWSLRGHGEPKSDNVKCGVFWNAEETYPANQFFEVFARFQAGGTYVAADNEGGRHAGLLLGVQNDGSVTGNTYVSIGGTPQNIDYGSGIPITLGDLGVLARVQTQSKIILYWKGFPIGVKEFSGTATRTFDDTSASGILQFFGTDHNGKDCNLVWARIMEGGTIPFPTATAYAPARSLAHNSQHKYSGEQFSFNGMWDFSNPYNVNIIPDLSLGREVIATKGKVLHHGYLSDSIANRAFKDADGEVTGFKPFYEKILFGQSPFTESVPTPPSGALVYNSHTRADISHQWSKTLSVAVGELGGNWQGETSKAGIVSKHLSLKDVYMPVWKVSPVADFEVTFTRANSPYLRDSGHYETYCPKMIDADNFIKVDFDPYGNYGIYDFVSRYGGGGTTTIVGSASTGVGQNWTNLRCRFVGTQMQMYLDNSLVTTQTVPSRWTSAVKSGLMDTTDNYRKLKSILIKAS